jgi:tetratricopeptide (TPR) repeat protein
VFVGGCTLHAAEAICADEDPKMEDRGSQIEQASILDGLATLIDKSLLRQVTGPDGDQRFMMLETIREYALEQLEASGEAERLRQQHARYYVMHWDLPNRTPQSPAPMAQLERDYDNLWSALTWSQTSAGDPEIALRLASGLRTLWMRRGMRREAIAALERSLNHPHGVGYTVGHAVACFALGNFLGYTGNYAAARIQFEKAVQVAHEISDPLWSSMALECLGSVAGEQGDSATAWARLSESLAIGRAQDNADRIAYTLVAMARVAVLDEDPARAEALLEERSRLRLSEPENPNPLGWALIALGNAAQLRGVYDRAAQLHQESLECFQAFGDYNPGRAYTYHNLGETALGRGNLDEAVGYLAQGLALSKVLGAQNIIAWCLAGLGSVAALDEEPERAALLWGAAERLREVIGCRSAPAARATYERALAMAHAQLDD